MKLVHQRNRLCTAPVLRFESDTSKSFVDLSKIWCIEMRNADEKGKVRVAFHGTSVNPVTITMSEENAEKVNRVYSEQPSMQDMQEKNITQ